MGGAGGPFRVLPGSAGRSFPHACMLGGGVFEEGVGWGQVEFLLLFPKLASEA